MKMISEISDNIQDKVRYAANSSQYKYPSTSEQKINFIEP